MGILPTFPNTGYGYIEYDKLDVRPIKQVVQFREKPDYATARKFIQSRNFLWNAGIFVWNVNAVLKAYEMYNPAMYQLFDSGYHFTILLMKEILFQHSIQKQKIFQLIMLF